MAHHLFMPDSNDFWYGEFANLTLHQKTLADELFKVVCSTYMHVAGDDHHLWVHDVAYSMEWTWCVCPVLVDIPDVGPALYLRDVSEPYEWESEFSDWMAETRRWFGQRLAHKLMLPVLVSDELDHFDMACCRPGFEDAAGYPLVDMVVTRAVSETFARGRHRRPHDRRGPGLRSRRQHPPRQGRRSGELPGTAASPLGDC